MAGNLKPMDLGGLSRGTRPITSYNRGRVDTVAVKVFFHLVETWGLSVREARVLLGEPSERTYYRWREGQVAGLPNDTLERISVLMGIYKALHILLPVEDRANAWIRRPNAAFGGASALDVMLRGRVDDLYQIRRHLDAWRG